jgi:hypothetical protein
MTGELEITGSRNVRGTGAAATILLTLLSIALVAAAFPVIGTRAQLGCALVVLAMPPAFMASTGHVMGLPFADRAKREGLTVRAIEALGQTAPAILLLLVIFGGHA